jgi:hypothetical protein
MKCISLNDGDFREILYKQCLRLLIEPSVFLKNNLHDVKYNSDILTARDYKFNIETNEFIYCGCFMLEHNIIVFDLKERK